MAENGFHEICFSDNMLKRMFQLIEKEYYNGGLAEVRGKPLINFKHPQELKKILHLSIPKHGVDENKLFDLCREVIKYSVRTDHPFFFNQLFGAAERVPLAGAILSECLNTSAYTYEVAPAFIMMEEEIFQYMRQCAGWTTGDGMICPGGSISNMYALSLARYHRYPESKTKGNKFLPDIRIYASEQSHYSMKKAVAFMGFGLDNLTLIPCDEQGRMQVDALEKTVEDDVKAGRVPLFVDATSGTTVLGAYDAIKPISKICKKHDIWLHVDGCLGASCLLSDKLKYLMDGVEEADSLAWNPHKLMGIPLQCCVFLTRHNILRQAHSANAAYLFQQDKFYDTTYDTGDKSIQCGRKTDIFKLWLAWQSFGESGYAKYVEHKFALARDLARRIRERPGFELVVEPSCINTSFWYIPPCLRDQERTKEWWQRLHKVAPQIKAGMTKEGSMLIGYQPMKGKVNFFRMITNQFEDTFDDMGEILDNIDRLGKDIKV